MAMAKVPHSDGPEHHRNGETSSSHAIPNGDSPSSPKSAPSTDRYGFVGGSQYTDPTE